MNVLIACEFSGRVRDAFIQCGHNAVSCDLLPSESSVGEHIQGDVTQLDYSVYDMVIAHPPCTYLCRSGLRWIKERNLQEQQQQAVDFFMFFTQLPVKYLAIENPIGIMSTRFCKPTQIIQPYMFKGCNESKATCLWLKGLPLLQPSSKYWKYKDVKTTVHYEPPSKDRWKNRSRTFQVIADEMAKQWSVV